MELKHFKQKFEDEFHPTCESLIQYLMLKIVGTKENMEKSKRIEVKGSGKIIYDRTINMFVDEEHLKYIDSYFNWITKLYCKPIDNPNLDVFPPRLIDYNTLVICVTHPYDWEYTEEELKSVDNPFRLELE